MGQIKQQGGGVKTEQMGVGNCDLNQTRLMTCQNTSSHVHLGESYRENEDD